MCLIIDKPANLELSASTLANASFNNPHGWGVMYCEGGMVKVEKGLKLAGLLDLLPKLDATRAIIHFRQATHGKVNVENCHPFRVTDDIWLMHNGIVSVPEIANDMSDTYNFCTYVLGPILSANPDLFGTDHLEAIIDSFDSSSKFALMRSDGMVQIINRKAGHDSKDGVWYSNLYSLQLPVPASTCKTWKFSSKDTAWWDDIESIYGEGGSGKHRSSHAKLTTYRDTPTFDAPSSLDELLALDYEPMLDYVKAMPEEVVDLLWNASYEWEDEERDEV